MGYAFNTAKCNIIMHLGVVKTYAAMTTNANTKISFFALQLEKLRREA